MLSCCCFLSFYLSWFPLESVGASGKEPTCQCRRHKRRGFDPGSGRSPGAARGNPLQYSCLENRVDRGASQATVHGVTKSQTQLKWLSTHTHVWSKKCGIINTLNWTIIYVWLITRVIWYDLIIQYTWCKALLRRAHWHSDPIRDLLMPSGTPKKLR